MNESHGTMTEQVAGAVADFQQQRTGHAPRSVTVVLSEGTLVVTLHGALTRAEEVLSRSPEGAAKVREFHRKLFDSSFAPLKTEIERITGVAVREAAAEVETASGAVVHVFTSGTMVQVFQFAGELSPKKWDGNGENQ